MLKKIRIALAAVFFVCITLLFIGIGAEWWGWMAKLQFLPACLALNFVVIIGVVLLTAVFGRIYCSVICPLGVYQDIIIWIRRKIGGKKFKYQYHKEMKIIRYGVWAIFVASIIAGIQVLVALLAPYSAYGRMVSSVVSPNGWVVPVVAAVTFVIVTVLAILDGRAYCNSVCPVGTTLGLISRFSIFRPIIDKSQCVGCHGCEKKCKSHCIDVDNRKVDGSRCVDCFACLEGCKLGGLKYTYAYGEYAKRPMRQMPAKKVAPKPAPTEEPAPKNNGPEDNSRRAFIATAALTTVAAIEAKAQDVDGGLAAIEGKKIPERIGRLVPFGAKGEKNFYNHCTACQLCVQNCPNGVLRPSLDLGHMMQPIMQYEVGYCRPECTKCSQVCPAGAILPITPEEKTMIHIGCAKVDRELCVVERDGVSCGNCARHCPVGAITMVPKDPNDRRSPRIPTVDTAKCIGCGACENLCPSRPISAITVNAMKEHIDER